MRTLLATLLLALAILGVPFLRPAAVGSALSTGGTAPAGTRYVDPWSVSVSPDGATLFVASRAADRVLAVSAADGRIAHARAVGEAPTAVVRDGDRLYVAAHDGFRLEVLDAATLAPRASHAVEAFPLDAVLAPGPGGGRLLWLTHHHLDTVVGVDPATAAPVVRIAAGRAPSGLLASPDGTLLLAGSYYPRLADPRRTPAAELTAIDTRRGRVAFRMAVEGAGLLRGGAFTPDGGVALIALQRSKNVIPNVAVREGWSMTHGLLVLVKKPGASGLTEDSWVARQVLLDDLEEGNAEPNAVAMAPDGRRAYVSCLASNRVLVLDVSKLVELTRSESEVDLAHRLDLLARFRVATIPTGPGPRALALSPEGDRLYVGLSLDESIDVIGTAAGRVIDRLRLDPVKGDTPERRGQKLFHSAMQSSEGRMSCHSCHPEGHHDGLSYDIAADGLGKNRVRIKTLLDSNGTAPFKWSGLNAGYYSQCGPRAARLIMHAQAYALPQLDDLVLYLKSLRLPPNPFQRADGRLTEREAKGKVLFERTKRKNGAELAPKDRCVFCHPGPRFTNNRAFDVGTKHAADSTALIDTPQLENLFMTRPFLHDGRSATLEEVFTLENPKDQHGVANDLDKDELNDLIEYMKTLGPRPAPARGGNP